MQVDEITATLRERGATWQAAGFAFMGIGSVALVSVYSDSDHWAIAAYHLATTQYIWAFLAPIAIAAEGVRKMFERATEIRRRYSEKADAKAEAKGIAKGEAKGIVKGREGERERIKAEMLRRGFNLTEDDEKALFNPNGHEG